MTAPQTLLDQNRAWSDRMQAQFPDLLDELSEDQSPDVLWIGCADSRVPAGQIVDCEPGDLFVHRNVANLIDASDPNSMSAVQYAVDSLDVSHIIVAGHYSCGGVRAALDDSGEGPLRDWLSPLRALLHRQSDELEGLSDGARWDRGCELNVTAQVQKIARTAPVQRAWEDAKDLRIHGWIYRLDDGRIRDLDVSVDAETFA